DRRRRGQAGGARHADALRSLRPRCGSELRVGEVIGLLARWLHLTSSIFLVGAAAHLLLAGSMDRPTARRWEACVLIVCRALVALALLSGLVTVAAQTAALEGRAGAAFEPAALTRMLTQTQGGIVWLVRGGLLVLLGVFLALRAEIRDRADWRAARGPRPPPGGGAPPPPPRAPPPRARG